MPHHRAVHADIVFLGGLTSPCGKENVAEGLAGQRVADGFGRGEVGGNGLDVRRYGRAATRESRHVPAGREQVVGEIAADNAACTNDKCLFLHKSESQKVSVLSTREWL